MALIASIPSPRRPSECGDLSPLSGRRAVSGGFTLIELLVVLGIITILIALIIPAVSAARKAARRARTSGDMQTIATALEAYHQDFGDYPRLDYTATAIIPGPPAGNPMALFANPGYISASELLAWALEGPYNAAPVPYVAPGAWHPYDGKDGLGFRVGTNNRGTVYGPYLDAERFLRNPANDPPELNQMQRYYYFIQDNFRQPILYFVRNIKPISNAGADLYNFDDNGIAFVRTAPVDPQAIPRFTALLDRYKPDGPYLLWSAGEDELFAVEDPANPDQLEKCDDVLFWGAH